MTTPNRNTHPENASACVLSAWERQQVNAKSNTWEARHRDAWTFNFNAPHDAMFRAQVRAIVATSDAVGGPQGDYLVRPHLLDLYRAAQCSLNYLDNLDGVLCDALLRALAEADGLDLDNMPESGVR
jgi:hypothetical protein